MGEKKVKEMKKAKSLSLLASSVIVFEYFHEVDQTRRDSTEIAPEG